MGPVLDYFKKKEQEPTWKSGYVLHSSENFFEIFQ